MSCVQVVEIYVKISTNCDIGCGLRGVDGVDDVLKVRDECGIAVRRFVDAYDCMRSWMHEHDDGTVAIWNIALQLVVLGRGMDIQNLRVYNFSFFLNFNF
eukprot:Pompholyxophrys_punicea_v1_NODE_1013_length_1042_cov_9.591692.p3 type:complete len:100 gc:universal NODE_1013_length_1042_cov_9.591692:361-62(-)